MKGCVLSLVVAAVAFPGFGIEKVDYEKMCSLVTNQLISLRHGRMKESCLAAIKAQTGANDFEIANCLGAYVTEKSKSAPRTLDYEQCLSAIGLLSQLASDEQCSMLAGLACDHTNALAVVSFGYYFRRMKKNGGLNLAERLLDDKSLGSAMRVEILSALKRDVRDLQLLDPSYRQALCLLGRRQVAKRQYCRTFDEMLDKIDLEYRRSDLRRELIRDVAQGKIPGMKLSPSEMAERSR